MQHREGGIGRRCVLLGWAGVLALTAGNGGCRPRPAPPARAPGDENLSPEQGRNRYVWRQRCAPCHGEKAGGVPEVGPDIHTQLATLNQEKLKEVILNGGEKMPAFKGKFTGQQLDWLMEHIKTLAGK